jgi:hypothetical protein
MTLSYYCARKPAESRNLADCESINSLRNMCHHLFASKPVDGDKGLFRDSDFEKKADFTAEFPSQISWR